MVLHKSIKFNLPLSKCVLKPIVASIIMIISACFIYYKLNGIISNRVSCVIAISLGAIIYCIMIVKLKILGKEQIMLFPYGEKIYHFLTKYKMT